MSRALHPAHPQADNPSQDTFQTSLVKITQVLTQLHQGQAVPPSELVSAIGLCQVLGEHHETTQQENGALSDEVDRRKANEEKLEALNSDLKEENTDLETRNTDLEARNTDLETRNTDLETRNTDLETRNANLEKEKVGLKEENTRLRLSEEEQASLIKFLQEKDLPLTKKNPAYPPQRDSVDILDWGDFCPVAEEKSYSLSRTELEHSFVTKDSYYSADVMDLLLYATLKQAVKADEKVSAEDEKPINSFYLHPATDLSNCSGLGEFLGALKNNLGARNAYAFIPLNVLRLSENYFTNQWVLLLYQKNSNQLLYIDPMRSSLEEEKRDSDESNSLPPEVSQLAKRLGVALKRSGVLEPVNFAVHSGARLIEKLSAFLGMPVRSEGMDALRDSHFRLMKETISQLDAEKEDLLNPEKNRAFIKKVNTHFDKLGLAFDKENESLKQYASLKDLGVEWSSPIPQEVGGGYQPLAKDDEKTNNPYVKLAQYLNMRVLVIEAAQTGYNIDGSYFDIALTHSLAHPDGLYAQIDADLETLVSTAHSVDLFVQDAERRLPTKALLKVGNQFFSLKRKSLEASPFYHQKVGSVTLLGVLVFLVALADALAHGMLNVSQLSKNPDVSVEVAPDKNIGIFLLIAISASIPKLFSGFRKLDTVSKMGSFGRYALIHPTMKGSKVALFMLWTAVAAILDGVITFNAVDRLFNLRSLSWFMAIADGLQFFVVEGSALAHKYEEPFFEAERELLMNVDPGSCDYVKKMGWIGFVNLLTLYGMLAITTLAAGEGHRLLEGLTSDEHIQKTGTTMIALLYLIYRFCLYGSRVKSTLYNLHFSDMKNAGHHALQNKQRLYWAPVILGIVGGSAFLNTITAQEGVSEFITSEKSLAYSLGSAFSIMAFCVTGLPLMKWMLSVQTTFPQIKTPSGLKDIYLVREAISHLGLALLIAVPQLVFNLARPDKEIDFNSPVYFGLHVASAAIFMLFYSRKIRAQYKKSGLTFQWCDLSCYQGEDYKYKLCVTRPDLREQLKLENQRTVFVFLLEGVPHYTVLERHLPGRIVTQPLEAEPEVVLRVREALLTLAQESRSDNASDLLDVDTQTRIEGNIFWHNPQLSRTLFFSVVSAFIMDSTARLMLMFAGGGSSENTSKAVNVELMGAVLGAILNVIFLHLTTRRAGHESRPDTRGPYRFRVNLQEEQKNEGLVDEERKPISPGADGSINHD